MAFYNSEECFRRYEAAIAQALFQYPKPVRFKTHRSLNTDQARCQDAITSYRDRRWPTTNPIFTEFDALKLKVAITDDGFVEIGPPVKHVDLLQVSNAAKGENNSVIMEPHSVEHVKAIITLIDQGVFIDPVQIPILWKSAVLENIEGLINIAPRFELEYIILF